MEKYHLGQEIRKEVDAKFPSVAAFAKELCKSSSATYEIFGKTSLDTDLLLKVSKLLDRDFFREFSEKCLNGEVAVEDKDMAENRLSCLLPEEELHVFTYDKHEMVFEEYFLLPRKKPLVAFCDFRSNRQEACINLACVVGENIFGKGMVRSLRFDSKDLAYFEAQIPMLTSIPQKAFVIQYSGWGLQNGYDYVILLAEKLLAASGKHVVLICSNRNEVDQYSLKYSSYAEPAFDTWKERIFACVLDNNENDFVYNRELYNAIDDSDSNKGYIYHIKRLLNSNISFEEKTEKVKQLIAEAEEKISTFKHTVIEKEEDGEEIEHHEISTLVIRPEDRELLESRHKTPRYASTWIEFSKATGEIFDWEDFMAYVLLHSDDELFPDFPTPHSGSSE